MQTITTYYRGDMLFESKLGNHSLLIDVPAGMGGQNRGPTPPDLFIASLGSCVAAFAASYCHQAGIDTRDMQVAVSFDKLENPTRLANIKVTVTLPFGDCRERNAALKRVAEHCPVHETIVTMQGIDVEFIGRQDLAAAA